MTWSISATSFLCWETAATSGSMKENRWFLCIGSSYCPIPEKQRKSGGTEAIKAGLGDLFLINVQSTYLPHGTSPDDVGFDAAMRFEPRARPAAHAVVRAWRTLRSPIHNDRFTRYEQIYRNWKRHRNPIIGISNVSCLCGTTHRAGQGEPESFTVPLLNYTSAG